MDEIVAAWQHLRPKSLWMAVMMRDYIQPVATRVVSGKRVSWHTMRRTYASLLQTHNDDPKVVQELLRHASIGIVMDIYAQAVTEKKRKAQTKVVGMVVASQRAAKRGELDAGQASAGDSC